jgi:hypothetical protein
MIKLYEKYYFSQILLHILIELLKRKNMILILLNWFTILILFIKSVIPKRIVGIGFDNTHIIIGYPYFSLVYPKIESVILFFRKVIFLKIDLSPMRVSRANPIIQS